MNEVQQTADYITWSIQLPDRSRVTIRENNGDDEGVLSSIASAQEGKNIREFLANIIVKDEATGKVVMADEIKKWKTNSMYYLTFCQRVLNLGSDFQFKYTCDNTKCNKESNYDEDLNLFLRKDFNDPDEKNPLAPDPVPADEYFYFQTRKGKKLRAKYLTHEAEEFIRKIPEAEINNNTEILQRGLEIEKDGEWVPVKFFSIFNSLEMVDLRSAMKKFDKQWTATTKFECPYCQTKHEKVIMYLPGFYYPEEQI